MRKKKSTIKGNVDQSWIMTKVITIITVAIASAAVLCSVAGCSPRIVERIVVQHDTTKVVKVDSIWQYQKDSVFIKEKGDTVYKYVEHIRYRDRIKVDTLVKIKVDSVAVETVKVVEVDKPLSWVQTAKIGAFWWLLLAVIALLGWTFRKPLLTLIKLCLK